MAACCGRHSSGQGEDEEMEVRENLSKNVPENDLSLERVHNIIDRMSTEEEPVVRKSKRAEKVAQEFPEDDPQETMPVDPDTSDMVKAALVATGKLWKREVAEMGAWRHADTRHTCLDEKTLTALAAKEQTPVEKKTKKKMRKVYQEQAYCAWKEDTSALWWEKVQASEEPPSGEQMTFLRYVEARCLQERRELEELQRQQNQDMISKKSRKSKVLKAPRQKTKLSEPARICLFGLPGAGKSTCIKHIRSYFQEALGWEEGVEFQFLASQNTMASLIGGQTLHHWSTIPVNAKSAGDKKMGKGAEGDVDALFLKVLAFSGDTRGRL